MLKIYNYSIEFKVTLIELERSVASIVFLDKLSLEFLCFDINNGTL